MKKNLALVIFVVICIFYTALASIKGAESAKMLTFVSAWEWQIIIMVSLLYLAIVALIILSCVTMSNSKPIAQTFDNYCFFFLAALGILAGAIFGGWLIFNSWHISPELAISIAILLNFIARLSWRNIIASAEPH